MGDKVYKPIVKDGTHLIRSKDNPDRVRGLTRDENNQNPDIIEWEEYDVDDLKSENIKNTVSRKKERKRTAATKTKIKKETAPDRPLAEVSSQIDKAFERFYFEMDEEEAKTHMMRLVYHMLGVVNEIRIISNARIRKDCHSEELCIERQKESEKFLSERVAIGLNRLLSDENLRLDLNTSREMILLTGGGVRPNGEYIPVQAMKIEEALNAISISEQEKCV